MSFDAATAGTAARAAGGDEIALLRQLVEIESPTFDAQASARIAELLEARFAQIGADVRLVASDAGTNLLAELPGEHEDSPLLLVGHTDTVWPVGTIESNVPWAEDGTRIAGPGVYDMKSGIVVMLTALARLRTEARRAVRVVLTCDEEVGSPTTQPLLRQLCAGASGVLGFESPHPDGALKMGRRGSSRVRLAVSGRSAHAGLDPELGVSAVDELVDQLIRVREITAAADPDSPVLCNVGMIRGGARTNVVPDRAVADIGLRFADPECERRVLDELRRLSPRRDGAAVDFELLSHRPTWRATVQDRALLATVAAAAGRVGQRVVGRPANGAGDTNLLGSLGIPTLDGFGPRGGGAHAESEHILVASLFERIELLGSVLTAAAPDQRA